MGSFPRVVLSSPRLAVCERDDLPLPGRGEVLIRNRLSALSAGTEGLAWRGELPVGLAIDAALPHLQREVSYPLIYGYAAVGSVETVGEGVDVALRGRRVFTFTAHQQFVVCAPDQLVFLPDDLSDDDAVFLASMETAVGLVHDAHPRAGEVVGILGLGTIGLLVGALLETTGVELHAWDRWENRRRALGAGAKPTSLTPQSCDVVVETSGNPLAVDQAMIAVVDAGRVVLGSWYGSKPVTLDLGGRYHRARIELVSSQVSTLAPVLQGRWSKARRLSYALACLAKLRPSRWITHRYSPEQAQVAYQLVSESPGECLQVVFTYD